MTTNTTIFQVYQAILIVFPSIVYEQACSHFIELIFLSKQQQIELNVIMIFDG